MKLKFWDEKPSIYDEPIGTVLNEMKTYGPDSPEFATQLTYLERLSEMKTKTKSAFRVSPDQLVASGAALLGIVIIVAYEQTHPMVSKARDHIHLKTS